LRIVKGKLRRISLSTYVFKLIITKAASGAGHCMGPSNRDAMRWPFSISLLGLQVTGECIGETQEPRAGQALRALRTGVVRHRFETFVDPIIDVAYIKTLSSSQR
jgi:hypothetical protein